MLKQLTVQDFALVEQLDIQFGPGLTVITGESGAGKSILLTALSLVLGERASSDLVRPGADRADVSAEFDVATVPAAMAVLDSSELADTDDPGRVLVRRVVGADGRSRAFINGVPVTRQVLRNLGADLVDVHGQFENQRLGRRDVQLGLVDDYAGARDLAAKTADAYRGWRQAREPAAALQQAIEQAADRSALLAYQLEELRELDLQPDEFAQLERDVRRLSQADQLTTTVGRAVMALEDLDGLRHVAGELETLDDDHPDLADARATLSQALTLVDDARAELRRYGDAVESDPELLAERQARLDVVHDLARKHRVGPESLAELYGELRAELDGMDDQRDQLEALEQACAAARAAFEKQAAKLSKKRRGAVKGFSKALGACINTLGIRGGELTVAFEDDESEAGLERAEFLVTTNPRYPPAPLGRIASGGEQARISLAIQVVCSERSRLPCLVLDEADVGVGGTTADTVGRLLRSLGGNTQVLCVTHAPQVAALGEHHLKVSKSAEQNTEIATLARDDRVEELARMLAGADVTQKTRDYATTLLTEAEANTLH